MNISRSSANTPEGRRNIHFNLFIQKLFAQGNHIPWFWFYGTCQFAYFSIYILRVLIKRNDVNIVYIPSWSSPQILATRPTCKACCAVIGSPVYSIQLASCLGTTLTKATPGVEQNMPKLPLNNLFQNYCCKIISKSNQPWGWKWTFFCANHNITGSDKLTAWSCS